jgi:hypothetical protein
VCVAVVVVVVLVFRGTAVDHSAESVEVFNDTCGRLDSKILTQRTYDSDVAHTRAKQVPSNVYATLRK